MSSSPAIISTLCFCKSPELKLGDELNTDGTNKPRLKGNKLTNVTNLHKRLTNSGFFTR